MAIYLRRMAIYLRRMAIYLRRMAVYLRRMAVYLRRMAVDLIVWRSICIVWQLPGAVPAPAAGRLLGMAPGTRGPNILIDPHRAFRHTKCVLGATAGVLGLCFLIVCWMFVCMMFVQ
jgi:hypothetical protein